MEAELFTCIRRNNPKTFFLRPNIDYATPCVCAGVLSNKKLKWPSYSSLDSQLMTLVFKYYIGYNSVHYAAF